ncbi:hypothetical protein FA15DRAFT_706488 [Coprinopsis marcescibilis]|uniref:Uncharacterized protein n=1 Tax=Coprinopsis marcescibilis TaxID=230819 RepID=A0A5C3KR74_COPMA|nr:hypothetical protein FA15DRAFT_706488 [Coprinopsis marcescibilis]
MPECLDVEDEEARQQRLQTALENLNASSPPPPYAGASLSTLAAGSLPGSAPYEVKTNTELLARIQEFLPQLHASNQELLQRARTDPNSVDIEHISEDVDKVIEMKLGLGVFQEKRRRRSKTADNEDAEMSSSCSSSSSSCSSSSSSSSSCSSSSSSDSSDGDDSDSDSDSSSSNNAEAKAARLIRALPKRIRKGGEATKPTITVLHEESFEEKECSKEG